MFRAAFSGDLLEDVELQIARTTWKHSEIFWCRRFRFQSKRRNFASLRNPS